MTEPLYYLRCQGEVTGPYSWEQLQAIHARGRLQPADEVSIDQVLWDHITDRADLFPPAETASVSHPEPDAIPTAPPMVRLAGNRLPRPRRRRPRDDDDEYDDEYDDAPSSSSGTGLVIGLVIFGVVGGLVLVVVVCLAAISFVGTRASTTFHEVGATLSGGVADSRMTRENFHRIQIGMRRSDVINILGQPDSVTHPQGVTTFTWRNAGKEIKVELDNDDTVISMSQKGLDSKR